MPFSKSIFAMAALLLAMNIAHAELPSMRMTSNCEMPTPPGARSTKTDWAAYNVLLADYNQCMGEKTKVYVGKAKKVLEEVGERVVDFSVAAKGWFAPQ